MGKYEQNNHFTRFEEVILCKLFNPNDIFHAISGNDYIFKAITNKKNIIIFRISIQDDKYLIGAIGFNSQKEYDEIISVYLSEISFVSELNINMMDFGISVDDLLDNFDESKINTLKEELDQLENEILIYKLL